MHPNLFSQDLILLKICTIVLYSGCGDLPESAHHTLGQPKCKPLIYASAVLMKYVNFLISERGNLSTILSMWIK